MRWRLIAHESKGRLRAAFLCAVSILSALPLIGCATDGSNPLVATLAAFLPGRADTSQRAKQVSFASLDFAIGGRGGLLILAEVSQGLTFWQTSRRETVVLNNGYLQSTSGIVPELQMTQVAGGDVAVLPWSEEIDEPVSYTVTRSWTTADGSTSTGRAQARLACARGTQQKKLPLTTLALQRCVETLSWARGEQTSSVLWRDPDNHRIWAAEVVAWPGSPLYDWRVARPWW